jgi:hypothetical protein
MKKVKSRMILIVAYLCIGMGGIYDKNSYMLSSAQWEVSHKEASGIDQDESLGSAEGEACAESEIAIEIPLIKYV